MITAGTVIGGRYKIVRHIAAGGMQDVYCAFDELMGLNVALKTPLPGQVEKRFQASARVAARINHHNVAKTLDYILDDGSQYIIEELVDGATLDARMVASGFVDPHLGARVLHNLAKGLAASHSAGVIHRDLKPSNVITTGGADLLELKITDFGIATLTEEVFEDAQKAGDLTRSTSGTIRGALPFMAPEMMFRKPGEYPGKEIDVWSLGAMMFRLLTGNFPFGEYLEAAVNVRTKQRGLWPGFMTANSQYRNLSEELKKIIEECLQYEPDHRPSASQLSELCGDLCYFASKRHFGTVSNFIQNGYSGFANGAAGKVFFSMQSVYGPERPNTANHSKICYSQSPGWPHPRAHPVIVIKG